MSMSGGPQRQKGQGTQKSKGEGEKVGPPVRMGGLQLMSSRGGSCVKVAAVLGQVAERLRISGVSWMLHLHRSPPTILPSAPTTICLSC